MGPNFNDPILVNADVLEVGGDFDPHGGVIGNVMIGFMIIPADMPNTLTAPMSGIAELINDELDKTPQDATKFAVKSTTGKFSKEIPNEQHLGVGHKVRVIGLSVAVKMGNPSNDPDRTEPDAPAFETFTWCVDRKVVAGP
jgi:hypothetical protein